jgi:hypothetical protein
VVELKKIFTVMNWIAGIIFLLSASAVDEATWFQIGLCAVSGGYLACAYLISEKRKKALRRSESAK